MKKTLISLLAALFILTSCGAGNAAESSSANFESEAVSKDGVENTGEASRADESPDGSLNENSKEESSMETSSPDTITPIKIMYCSYDQKPYAVIVGTCGEGAVVHASVADGQEIDSKSFYGWFSVRFKHTSGETVVLTQSINGVLSGGEAAYNGTPANPGKDEGIVAGNDSQFFYSKCLNDFMCTNLPSDGELQALTTRIKERIKGIEDAGLDTKIIYILAPSPIAIYPEAVPENYKQGQGKTRRVKVMDALRAAGATVIDLEGVFNEHKNDAQTIYYKTDSHWTEYAAFLAYTELFNVIKADFPDAAPYDYDYFNWYSGYFKTGDMLNYLKMTTPVYLTPGFFDSDCLEYSWFRDLSTDLTGVKRKRFDETGVYSEEVTAMNLVETKRSGLPNCIVIRDSYGTQLNDLIAGNMNVTYYQRMWDYTYNLGNIKRYEADYVIYILAEWNVGQVLYN